MAGFLDQDMGIIWVQPDGPGGTVYPLACYNSDGIERNRGDVTIRLCRGPDGKWAPVLRSQGLPTSATASLEAYHPKVRDYLMRQAELGCDLNVYFQAYSCGRQDTFGLYEAGQRLEHAIITTDSKSNWVRGMADEGAGPAEAQTMSFDLTGDPDAPDYRLLIEAVRSVAEDESFRDIGACPTERCYGSCGLQIKPCSFQWAVCDAAAAATADVWYSVDEGATWAAVGTDPFAADEDVASGTCFILDRTHVRLVVARGTTDVANPYEIAYADYDTVNNAWGAWTTVNVGAVNGEYALHGGALFSLDGRHIWTCTDQGNIYFSDDYGATWADQGAPTPGGGAEGLYKVHFYDSSFGTCVGGTTGASSVYLYTVDGGTTWALGTGPAAILLTGCHTVNEFTVFVSGENGTIYRATNIAAGAAGAWTLFTPAATPDALGDITFQGEFDGLAVGYRTIGGNEFGACYRTVNGGADWEEYLNDTTFDGAIACYGLNAGFICQTNHRLACGEQVGSVGKIADLADAAPA